MEIELRNYTNRSEILDKLKPLKIYKVIKASSSGRFRYGDIIWKLKNGEIVFINGGFHVNPCDPGWDDGEFDFEAEEAEGYEVVLIKGKECWSTMII